MEEERIVTFDTLSGKHGLHRITQHKNISYCKYCAHSLMVELPSIQQALSPSQTLKNNTAYYISILLYTANTGNHKIYGISLLRKL